MKLIVTIDDLKKYRPLANEIPVARITPYIIEAQLNDLKPVLGDVLFWDFINKFDIPLDLSYTKYQELLNGKLYTPAGYSGNIQYLGLIPVVSNYALARFYENNQINATRYGLVQKVEGENSQALDFRAVSAAIDSLRSIAFGYENDVKLFLQSNKAVYSSYSDNQTNEINGTGVKFFDL